MQLRPKLPSGWQASDVTMWPPGGAVLAGLVWWARRRAAAAAAANKENKVEMSAPRRRSRHPHLPCLRQPAARLFNFIRCWKMLIRIWNKETGMDMSALLTEKQEKICCIHQPDAEQTFPT